MSSTARVQGPGLQSETIPPELDRWNWGAFLLNWIWGLGNNTFIALLMFVPLVNIVMLFVLGARGSRWAWRNGTWTSPEHFRRVQRRWAIAGLLVWFVVLPLVVAGGVFGGMAALRSSTAYELGAARLKASPKVSELLGSPVETGWPMGSVQIDGASGSADMSFSVTGPKKAGTAYLTARKALGDWALTDLRLKLEDGTEVDVGTGSAPRVGRLRFTAADSEVARTRFAPADHKVVLLLDIAGAKAGTTVEATWLQGAAGAQETELTTSTLVVDEKPIDSMTFSVTNNRDWQPGSYGIRLTVDGQPAGNATFEVAAP